MTVDHDRSQGPALEVRDVTASYGDQVVVNQVSLAVSPGHILGLAGESGCGKSSLALAAMGFRQGGLRIRSGQSLIGGEDLLQLDTRQLRSRWGAKISYVPQGAAASLNPAHTIATHFRLLFRRHLGLHRRASDLLAGEWLERVQLPADALRRYPHQFSGGQQQRISLALALGCRPRVLILDEPTTGLDVTTQALITKMLRQMVDELSLAAVYVSHDLALLGGMADELAVMYAGEIIESGPAPSVLGAGRHPYSRALLAAVPSVSADRVPVGIPGSPPSSFVQVGCSYAPRCERAEDRCLRIRPPVETTTDYSVRCHFPVGHTMTVVLAGRPSPHREPAMESATGLLTVSGLTCRYRTSRGVHVAVDDVHLSVSAGETLAVVGESGSGKSTLLRTLAGIHTYSDGELNFAGERLAIAARKRPAAARGAIQIIFQNSDLALNPRRTVGDAIDRNLKLFRSEIAPSERRRETAALLDLVHLPASSIDRLPGQLSGGQRQRVAFARAFASRPKVLLCDEITSALDVSVQATVLALLEELSTKLGTAVIFVSHDLAVVRSIADRIAVMQNGRICETAATRNLFASPRNSYTRQLLASAPSLALEADRASVDAQGG